MRKNWIPLGLISLSLGLLLMGSVYQVSAAPADKTIKWRLQSSFPSGSLAYDELVKRFVQGVESKTDGRLKIIPFPPGALAKVLETYDAVAAGAIEMCLAGGVYHARKIPEALVEFGLPFSFKDFNQCYEWFYDYKDGEALRLIRKGYEDRGTFLLGMGPTGQYAFMTKFPVKGIEDFKGKKMRTFGLFSVLVKRMGASPVSIPGAEMYLALQRGTIDGTIYPPYVLETFKLKEVVNYVILPAVLTTPIIEFYVNLKAWQGLPDELKKIAEQTLREVFRWYSKASIDLDWKNIDLAKEVGVKTVILPDGEVQKLRAMAEPIWDIPAGKSDRCAKLVQLLRDFFKEKGN